MNTNDGDAFNADGVYEVWIDGVLIHSRNDIPWPDDGSVTSPRKGWSFVGIGGNNNNRWIADCEGTECEQWYAIDDVVIATKYIGPDYEIGSGTMVENSASSGNESSSDNNGACFISIASGK